MHTNETTQALVDVGFTPTEAEIYVFLLGTSPASGYRIAQATGKPAPQVYRAIESLARAGAVIVAEGKTRLCRAVPVDECLRNLEESFAARKSRAEQALRQLPCPTVDDRVYQLDSRDQVLAKARSMIQGARSVLLVDVFPEPFFELRGDIESAPERDVPLLLQVYEDVRVDGAALSLVAPDAPNTVERWLGQQLSVNADGKEFLTAVLSRDGRDVLHAFWSTNEFLSAMHYNGLICEFSLTHLRNVSAESNDDPVITAAIARCEPFFLTNSPAMAALTHRTLGSE